MTLATRIFNLEQRLDSLTIRLVALEKLLEFEQFERLAIGQAVYKMQQGKPQ